MYGGSDRQGYDRIILRRAKTIEGLAAAEEIVIWDEQDDPNAFRYIWAPEIHEIDGSWYVLFTASNEKDNVWGIKCHVLACTGKDPYTDAWVNKGVMQTMEKDTFSFRWFSLDMTYFECNGVHYVAWAQTDGNSNVYLATINPEEPWKLTSHPMLLTKPEYYWEKVSIPVNEGPAAMIENGKIYADIEDPNSILWSVEKYNNNSYAIQNAGSGRYLHPFYNSGSDNGITTPGRWGTTISASGSGVKFTHSAYITFDSRNNQCKRNRKTRYFIAKIQFIFWIRLDS
jgi:GH43 family beta-xylosidase